MRNKPLPGMMKHSPLKDHEKTPDGKVIKHKTGMEFHASLLQKPNVGPPYEKGHLGYPVKEVINPKSKKKGR